MNVRTMIRLAPTLEQADFLRRQIEAARFVYNMALKIKQHRQRFHGENLSPSRDIKKLLAVAKRSRKYAWLAEFDSQILCKAVDQLERDCWRFSNHGGKQPKARTRISMFNYALRVESVKFGDDFVVLPKIGKVKATPEHRVKGKVWAVTIMNTGGLALFVEWNSAGSPSPLWAVLERESRAKRDIMVLRCANRTFAGSLSGFDAGSLSGPLRAGC